MGNFNEDFEDPGTDILDCIDHPNCQGDCMACEIKYQQMVDEAERQEEINALREE